jgi:5-methylcytosine-specific restriction endonuclease McrA
MRKGDTISVPRSDEHRRKLSLAMLCNLNQEKMRSPETRCKIAQALMGNTHTLGYRHSEEMKQRCRLAKMGECNPAWCGGISYEPYSPEFNSLLKEEILKRDKYQCLCCGKEQQVGETFHIHHLNYDKQDNHPENLITLCHSCHSRTNHYRHLWKLEDGKLIRLSGEV